MGNRAKDLLGVALAFTVLGIVTDFLFNAVVVGQIFHSIFREHWIVIYGPVYFALTVTVSSFILRTRWSAYTREGVIAFVIGTIVGHLALAGRAQVRSYAMSLDRSYPGILLRSAEWPQILFVTGGKIQRSIASGAVSDGIPVTVDLVTDYGCIRSAVVSTVAGVDVRYDHDATWTWQLDHFASTRAELGPGLEDHALPWCRHAEPLKALENPPGRRIWEQAHSNAPAIN